MAWGCIGIGYKSPLYRVQGSMNGDKYRAMLRELRVIEELDEINGVKQWMLQDDVDMPHRSKETRDWLNERCLNVSNKETFNWSAYSPDLNPIEHM
jgi:hypothetical protein